MPNPIAQSVKQTTKDLAKNFARQVAREPLEILKTATDQVRNIETRGERPADSDHYRETNKKPDLPDPQKLQAQSRRLMQAFEQELEDIRNLEAQKRMQVLNQEEKQEEYKEEEKKQGFFSSVVAQGKKRRQMFGQKGKKGPNQPTGTTKAEVRKPPSG